MYLWYVNQLLGRKHAAHSPITIHTPLSLPSIVFNFDLFGTRLFKACSFACSYFVHALCFLQVMDKPEFKDQVYTLKPTTETPGRRALIGILEKIGNDSAMDIANILRDEPASIEADEWTSCLNDSYLSLNVAFITTGWGLAVLPLDSAESHGSTKGEDFVEKIEGMVTRHDLTGRAVA